MIEIDYFHTSPASGHVTRVWSISTRFITTQRYFFASVDYSSSLKLDDSTKKFANRRRSANSIFPTLYSFSIWYSFIAELGSVKIQNKTRKKHHIPVCRRSHNSLIQQNCSGMVIIVACQFLESSNTTNAVLFFLTGNQNNKSKRQCFFFSVIESVISHLAFTFIQLSHIKPHSNGLESAAHSWLANQVKNYIETLFIHSNV